MCVTNDLDQGEAIQVPAVPSPSSLPAVTAPIRTRPSLPRSERLLRPLVSRIPLVANQERFVARPTKFIPSVLKLAKNLKPVSEKKLAFTEKETALKTISNESQTGASFKKPISAFKSVSASVRQGKKVVESKDEDTPVYIPRYVVCIYEIKNANLYF